MFIKVVSENYQAIYDCDRVNIMRELGELSEDEVRDGFKYIVFTMEQDNKPSVCFKMSNKEKNCAIYIMNNDGRTIDSYYSRNFNDYLLS